MDKQCKYCQSIFDIDDKPKGWIANHTRWCDKNPKRTEYASNLVVARESISDEGKKTNQFIKAKRLGHEIISSLKGRPGKSIQHTEETRKKMSISALNSNHRRLKKNTSVYNGILMDSSWEVELAKRLDFLEINWIRPEPLKWKDVKGLTHNYFPDFYLTDFDIYLDPKNPHAFTVQKEKIEILNSTYDNIIWIKSLNECKNFTI